MNLVTAILVDNAVICSQQDLDFALQQKADNKKKVLEELQGLFELVDTNGNGAINWEEFKASFDNPAIKKKWALLDFDADECKDLFDTLDDGDGEISVAEFFDGLLHMRGQAMARDILRLQKTVRSVAAKVHQSQNQSSSSQIWKNQSSASQIWKK